MSELINTEGELPSAEFTFYPIGVEGGEAIHRAIFVGTVELPTVTIFRSDQTRTSRIAFDVPRNVAAAKGYVAPAEIVRDAIGQALRDNLFNEPRGKVEYLDGDAPRWLGNLTAVR